jgi:hypothetical protein
MKSAVSLVVAALIISFFTRSAVALPRFALASGAKCGSCHVNPTGGQMRSEYGTQFSLDKVSLESTKDDDFSFDPKISDNITLGGDYRMQFLYDGLSKLTTFQAMTASLYASINVGKKITFFLKQDLINGSYGGLYNGLYAGTEVYGLFKLLPGNWYLKGGSFLPEYGWKLDDHTAYTRGGDLGFTGAGFHPGLFFTPNYNDIGFEIGGSVSHLSITAGFFNGTGQKTPIDFNADKAYVAKIEYVESFSSLNCRIGASGYGYKNYKMAGVLFGLGTESVVFLAEADWTRHALGQFPTVNVIQDVHQMTAYAELNVRAMQGLWFVGKYDMFDPLRGVSDDDTTPTTNTVKRVTVGFELFPYSFVEVRPQYRYTLERPSISNDVFLIQTHLWF